MVGLAFKLVQLFGFKYLHVFQSWKNLNLNWKQPIAFRIYDLPVKISSILCIGGVGSLLQTFTS